MTATALQIANALIQKAHQENNPISNMKLQKLVYFAYGWYYAIKEERLFEEPIQAWKYGPVLPDLYHKFKLYFSNPIPVNHFFVPDGQISEEHQELVDKIWEVYGRFTAGQLSDRTHMHDTPWDRAYHQGLSNVQIKDDDIKEHFKGLMQPA
ncbi:Panacea domain-containing protein [Neptunomonas marina]|uniref:DUF4065 domain-containing protein n=1 Tax=Neptunomonas marina TaxID=1815562 RepID=A0A437Q614_9GAMM|nr:type II toxin-antitoxin system antitoxin SocA domain-containing protein [Neptunomonas marina]RVU29958.1 DUF4065 domain-containing protein [Neptunomonas marina]